MTGPYAYDDKNHWLAFDDATSLKIKTKYALLRNLGGVGLYSIDADDIDNHCGNGAFSLIRSIHATLSHLDRRPRQLIVHRYFILCHDIMSNIQYSKNHLLYSD